DLIAAGNFDELQSAWTFVVALQLIQRGVNVLLRLACEQLVDRFRGQRLGGRKDQRLEDRLQLGIRLPVLPYLLPFLVFSHDVPPGPLSDAVRWSAARACTRGSAQTPPTGKHAPASDESSQGARGM